MDGPSCDSSDDDHPTALDAEVGVVHPINLSDPGAEEALYDIQSMRTFCGLELGRDAIPDETTILNFRHLLERHALTKAIFAAVAEHLEAKGEMLRGGTIVDATLIAASPSTKNKQQQARSRDVVVEEGKPVVFRHEGARRRRCEERPRAHGWRDDGQGPRRQGDAQPDPRGRPAVYGDKGYASDERKRAAERAGVCGP